MIPRTIKIIAIIIFSLDIDVGNVYVRVEAVLYGAGVTVSHRVTSVAYGGRRELVVAVGAETKIHSEAPIG